MHLRSSAAAEASAAAAAAMAAAKAAAAALRESELPVHTAALGHADKLRRLIEAGANITRGDKYGQTPLHYAAAAHSVECAKVLLEAGAPLWARDLYGRTPLITALYDGRRGEPVEIVELLSAAGSEADLKATDKRGWSALFLSSQYNFFRCQLALAWRDWNYTEQELEKGLPIAQDFIKLAG